LGVGLADEGEDEEVVEEESGGLEGVIMRLKLEYFSQLSFFWPNNS